MRAPSQPPPPPAAATEQLTLAEPSGHVLAAITQAPVLRTPPNGTLLQNMGAITLSFDLPAGATQYHIQLIPFNGDGPGANLIRNPESSFTLLPPTLGVGPYVILPGMTYTWRLRATDKPTSAPELDPSWGPWSDPSSFTTPPPSADSIRAKEPPFGTTATSLTPTLIWTDDNPFIFYYEIELSKDSLFDTNPMTANAAVYQNRVHGGEARPNNSWAVPSSFPLERGVRYYWRVRPRVQGNGTPVNWPIALMFNAPGTAITPSPTVTPSPGPGSPTVTPTPPPTTGGDGPFTLIVTRAGTGSGSVTSLPQGITCPIDCSEAYAKGTVVVLTATPLGGSRFDGWSGDSDCSDGVLTMNSTTSCIAIFTAGGATLTVTKAGSGSGTVTSSPQGINCGIDCSESYETGTVVQLTAIPASGSQFAAWTGDSDCTDGQVTMNTSKSCTALFDGPTPTPVVSQPPTNTPTPSATSTATSTPTPTRTPTPAVVTRTFPSANDASVGTIRVIDGAWPVSPSNVRNVGGPSNFNAIGVDLGGSGYQVFRSFVTFDTRDIPSNATISAVSLSMYIDRIRNADGTTLEVTASSQGDTLAADDFSRIGARLWSVPLASLQQLQMNNFTLSPSSVVRGGRTQFAFAVGLDLNNQRPNGTDDRNNDTATYLDTENFGIKLTVTYTA